MVLRDLWAGKRSCLPAGRWLSRLRSQSGFGSVEGNSFGGGVGRGAENAGGWGGSRW
jgi:hypothetical protein